MKKLYKVLTSSFLSLIMLMSSTAPILAAGSINKQDTTTTSAKPIEVVVGYGNDNKGAGTSSGVSSKYSGTMYSQSAFFDSSNTSPFTLESQYTQGMSEDEEDEYYQTISLAVYEDASVEIVDSKWQRVDDPIVKIITNLNESKITYVEAIQETLETQNVNMSVDKITSNMISNMFKNYATICEEKGLNLSSFSLDNYTMLSEVEDLILYDSQGNVVHGSNIQATLSNSLINENIDPDRLFVLHYNTNLESWELIPTFNVDTENGTADCIFNNLSPFTFLYLNANEEETTTTTSSGDCCNDKICSILRHKFCKYLCINGTCWCWVIVVILAIIFILIIVLLIKAYLDYKKKKGDDSEDDNQQDDHDDFLI